MFTLLQCRSVWTRMAYKRKTNEHTQTHTFNLWPLKTIEKNEKDDDDDDHDDDRGLNQKKHTAKLEEKFYFHCDGIKFCVVFVFCSRSCYCCCVAAAALLSVSVCVCALSRATMYGLLSFCSFVQFSVAGNIYISHFTFHRKLSDLMLFFTCALYTKEHCGHTLCAVASVCLRSHWECIRFYFLSRSRVCKNLPSFSPKVNVGPIRSFECSHLG